jgi:hypothetical protein
LARTPQQFLQDLLATAQFRQLGERVDKIRVVIFRCIGETTKDKLGDLVIHLGNRAHGDQAVGQATHCLSRPHRRSSSS